MTTSVMTTSAVPASATLSAARCGGTEPCSDLEHGLGGGAAGAGLDDPDEEGRDEEEHHHRDPDLGGGVNRWVKYPAGMTAVRTSCWMNPPPPQAPTEAVGVRVGFGVRAGGSIRV